MEMMEKRKRTMKKRKVESKFCNMSNMKDANNNNVLYLTDENVITFFMKSA